MDIEQQQASTDASTASTTPTPATPEVSSTPVPSTPSVDVSGQSAAPTPAEVYQANFKFKYTGKNGDKWGDAEGEFDEPIRGLIKSKDDEEKWKKFYSKAYGFDFVNEGREKARTELKQYQEQSTPILKYAQEATKHYKAGDLDSFFEVLGVPYDKIQQHVYQKLQQQELPPEQRNLIEQNRAYQKELAQYQERMQSLEQNTVQAQREALYNDLHSELSKPDVSQVQQAFDARNGAGSFEEEIRQRGHSIYVNQNGRVAKPSELVQDILNRFGLTQAQQQAQQPNQVPGQRTLPTIPVVSGGGSSPVKKRIGTIADIEKEYNSLS